MTLPRTESAVELADRLVELIASGVSIEIAPLAGDGVLVRLSRDGHIAASGKSKLLDSLRSASEQFHSP